MPPDKDLIVTCKMALIELSLPELKLKRLNDQIDMVEAFLRLHVQVLWYLSVLWTNHKQLLHDYNALQIEVEQLRDENRHLWLIMEMDE